MKRALANKQRIKKRNKRNSERVKRLNKLGYKPQK